MCNRYSAQLNDSRRELKLLTVRVAFPYMWPIAQNKSDATYTLKTPSRTQLPMQTCHYTGGSMSRTDNFRNASCLEVKESTTKRAKSQIKRSSLRQWITRAAKSVTVALRLNLVDSNCLKDTGWGLDRSASRKRFLCAEQVGQSKSACHSVSSTFSPLILQKRQKRFNSTSSLRPGNFFHRDSCEFHLAKSAIPLRKRSNVCRCSWLIASISGKIASVRYCAEPSALDCVI